MENINKILLSLILISVIAVHLVHAQVEVAYTGYLGKISKDSVFSTTTTTLDNYNAIGFVCSSDRCGSISRKIFDEQSSSSLLILTYPKELESPQGYGVYFFKEGYIPWEVAATWHSPTPVKVSRSIYLSKKEGCFAPITNLIIANEGEENIPAIINMTVSIDAKTYAALRNAGPLDYIPSEISSYYKVRTDVTMEVIDSENITISKETKYLDIDASNYAWVSFTWIPKKKGSYTIKVYSKVPDSKCLSSEIQISTGTMEVLEARPRNICYSLIKSFERNLEFPEEDESIVFTYEKISNYAQPDSLLYPIKSSVYINFLKEGKFFKNLYFLLDKNSNPDVFAPLSFNLKFPEGSYTANLRIIGNDTRCDNIPNLETIRTMGFIVIKNQTPIPPEPVLSFEIISPQNKSYSTDNIPLIVVSNKNTTFSYSLNSGERLFFASPSEIKAEQGSNTVEVFAENQSKKVAFYVDSIAPSIKIISPEAKTYNNSTILVSILAQDENLNSVKFQINNGPIDAYSSPLFRKLADGMYKLKATAEDALGNIAEEDVSFIINTTINPPIALPSVKIISPEAKTYTNSTVPINIQVTGASIVSIIYSINNGENQTYTSLTTKQFADGIYILRAYATNPAGTASDEVVFQINTSKPIKPPSGGGGKVKITECVPIWKCSEWTECDSTAKQYRICHQEDNFCEKGDTPEMTRPCKTIEITPQNNSQHLASQSMYSKKYSSVPIIALILSIIIEIIIISVILFA